MVGAMASCCVDGLVQTMTADLAVNLLVVGVFSFSWDSLLYHSDKAKYFYEELLRIRSDVKGD